MSETPQLGEYWHVDLQGAVRWFSGRPGAAKKSKAPSPGGREEDPGSEPEEGGSAKAPRRRTEFEGKSVGLVLVDWVSTDARVFEGMAYRGRSASQEQRVCRGRQFMLRKATQQELRDKGFSRF